MLAGQSLDCQIVRTATGYTVTITEVSGESIVSEVVLNVVWADITEAMRFGLLALYCEQLVLGGERGVRQADVALRAGRARCTAQG